MSDKKCGACQYFDTSTVSNTSERATCRIHPPTADAKTEYGIWPKVDYDDWCGAFREAPQTYQTNDDDIAF